MTPEERSRYTAFARTAGRQAYGLGRGKDENPYTKRSESYFAWLRGWNDEAVKPR